MSKSSFSYSTLLMDSIAHLPILCIERSFLYFAAISSANSTATFHSISFYFHFCKEDHPSVQAGYEGAVVL